MKKKIFIPFILILVAVSCFSFTSCGTFEVNGGKSAYEIAVENGFKGTESEWLKSLEGADGMDGTNGSGTDIYELFDAYKAEINPNATFAEFLEYFSVVGYYDTEYATAKAMQSAVSVYSTFSRKIQRPGQFTDYSSGGAGVIYKIEDGYVYIITNYHVVYDRDSSTGTAKNIEVYSYGNESAGKTVQAEFIGGSITKDIAVLKAVEQDFSGVVKAVTAADSNEISLGEKTIAIGNPSGIGISVSSGIVSVDSEEIEMEALDSPSKTITLRVIRTDTPINSGNSGGGLFNARGELIGITNAKTVQSGVENIGYAIPINVAAGIADCVIENDSKKFALGININTIATTTRYDTAKGKVEIIETVSISGISDGTPAESELQNGDILLAVQIETGEMFMITRIFHLPDYLYNVCVSDTVYLDIERGGEVYTIEFTASTGDFIAV